jgi:SpoVK/Ycf46/Vps4 family AAA+-type ATPase
VPPSSDDDEFSLSHSRRKRPKLNYADIENNYDNISDIDDGKSDGKEAKPKVSKHDDDDEEAEIDEEDDDEDFVNNGSRRKTSRKQPKASKKLDENDDDSFNEVDSDAISENYTEDSDDSVKREARRGLRNFISKDDDDSDDDTEYGEAKRRSAKKNQKHSKKRSRSQRRKTFRKDAVSDDDVEDDTNEFNETKEAIESPPPDLLEEIADLQDSDASPRPRSSRYQRSNTAELDSQPRSLRERKKEVNYAIPPPLSENFDELNAAPMAPPTPRKRGGAISRPVWRLFPTGGPFGGGDVTSVFGRNYPGLSGNNNLLAGGADSDSSDDEILPINSTSNKRNSISAPAASKKKQIADSDPLGVDMNIDFSAVGGLDTYINQLKEMVALPLLYPEVYQRFSITPPRGVLFHGPPGTGKTLMARALAASYSSEGRKITFFMRKGADCLSKWVGEAERQLRLLFEEAKKHQPSIIFFDEIDGLAPVRSSKQEQIHASIVSTLLALMDGMDNRGQVIVIGATNRPDAVDPALRRPGRFDREFYFPLPDIKAREEILTIHTKKWDPPLSPEFVSKIAHLTKGYGGADLRALCTEAALNSIQRKYPQIYASNDKLKIDPSTITVSARDFMKAVDKIIPSSTRSTSSGSAPIPDHLVSILERPLQSVTLKLDKLIPRVKKLTTLEEAQFEDPTENDNDGGFAKQEFIKLIESSRVHRPRLLITGLPGNGQQYLGSAVLNYLEGFNIQSLDLGSLFGDSTRTAETTIIQSFIEARRHKPSIIYIPNIDIWFNTLPESAKATLAGLLRSVSSNERILLLGISEVPLEQLDDGLKYLFGISDSNFVELELSSDEERSKFFQPLWNAMIMKPNEYLDTRRKRKLPKLPKLKEVKTPEQKSEDVRSLEKQDMRLKNTLKIKLSGLMDLFKNRYRKFKKPTIDPMFLGHLFEPPHPGAPLPLYAKDGDQIAEISTGRRFFNMDLDTIEERLWNGFYSEPKQFLKDIEMIYSDAVTFEDRERLIKASEMLANAQVGIEEISTPEFVEQCKQLRRREITRIKAHEEKIAKLKQMREVETTKTLENGTTSAQPLVLTETNALMEGGDAASVATPGTFNDILNPIPVEDTVVQPKEDEVKITKEVSLVEDVHVNGNGVNHIKHVGEIVPTNGVKETEEAQEVDSEPEPEHESEPEPELPPLPDFELDEEEMEKLKHLLVEKTDGLTVEILEQVNAHLMEIVWDGHAEWNRNSTLQKLKKKVSQINFEEL